MFKLSLIREHELNKDKRHEDVANIITYIIIVIIIIIYNYIYNYTMKVNTIHVVTFYYTNYDLLTTVY